MARRGTPPLIKSAPFKVPTNWPLDGSPQAPGKAACAGAPAPELTEAQLITVLSTLDTGAERQRELMTLMGPRLHWTKRFHIQGRLAFDQEPARADVSAALDAAGNALRSPRLISARNTSFLSCR